MRNLQYKQPVLTPIDRFGAGYQDFLQAPLQPLTVNLESITYEVFEKDPVKYDWYEKAIARALHDWVEQGKPTSNPDGRVVVAVVGAGRGPLVTRALRASEDVGVEIDMWALEKNPNAFVLLQRHNESIWKQRVSLVKSDMRTWRGPMGQANAKHISQIFNKPSDGEATTNPPLPPSANFTGSTETDSTYLLATATHQPTYYKIDILISELLGSFADNELSPECLDGVQHLLNPSHGISIPASYTAFISPIAAPKLYADITNSMLLTTPNAAEIPYVVMLNAVDHVSTCDPSSSSAAPPRSPLQAQPTQPHSKADHRSQPSTASMIPPTPEPVIRPTWSFHHPNHALPPPSTTPSNTHNSRVSTTSFTVPNRATLHGLAGYFESVLYPGVELSTNPLNMDAKSEGMISWFPIYFPLKSGLYVPDGGEVQVCMWRKTDERKVWYEWQADVYMYMPDMKGKAAGKGKRVRIGGSELHSSEKEGCLM
jgi:type II protein arginine methyltransferase